jgi:hypothetical protein
MPRRLGSQATAGQISVTRQCLVGGNVHDASDVRNAASPERPRAVPIPIREWLRLGASYVHFMIAPAGLTQQALLFG